jgi:hypothetical protein
MAQGLVVFQSAVASSKLSTANDTSRSPDTNTASAETGHGGETGPAQRPSGTGTLPRATSVRQLTIWQVTAEKGFEILDETSLQTVIELM